MFPWYTPYILQGSDLGSPLFCYNILVSVCLLKKKNKKEKEIIMLANFSVLELATREEFLFGRTNGGEEPLCVLYPLLPKRSMW